eukprot:TRINITY_DN1484_c0_g2_i1.p1 TRINITY_DN1484_c0_g2~~TRINITY_DN1484_c0_g2_i1.p1  ORF type:complete len:114 (+),score=40.31 TRINITY_DN1484_c0_g2_i1:183-524(+)
MMPSARGATLGLQIAALVMCFVAIVTAALFMFKSIPKMNLIALVSCGISWILSLIGFIIFGANYGVAAGYVKDLVSGASAHWGFSAILSLIAMIIMFFCTVIQILANFVMKAE